MADKAILFKEKVLKKVIYAATLMSAADNELHDKERATIEDFTTAYWKENFGEFQVYLDNIVQEIRELIKDELKLQQTIEKKARELNSLLKGKQKRLVMDFLGKIMLADNRLHKTEFKILGILKKGSSE